MLSIDDFKAFGKDHVLFLHVTSRLKDEKYGDLLSEKGGQGFPYVVAMDAEGTVLSQLEDRSVDGFKAMMKAGSDYVALKSKKDRTPAEEYRLLSLDLLAGRIDAGEFREKATKLEGLDEATAKDRDALLLHADIDAELQKLRKAMSADPKYRIAAGKVFAEMHKAGRIPQGKNDLGAYYELMLDYAESAKDPALFAEAFGQLKTNFGDRKNLEPFWKKQEERLEKLKAPAGEKKEEGAGKEEGGEKKEEGGGK